MISKKIENIIIQHCAGIFILTCVAGIRFLNAILKLYNPENQYIINDTISMCLVFLCMVITCVTLIFAKLENDDILWDKICNFVILCSCITLFITWLSDISWRCLALIVNSQSTTTLDQLLSFYIINEKWFYFTILSLILTLHFLKKKKTNSHDNLNNKQSAGHNLRFLAVAIPVCILVVPIGYNLIIFFITHPPAYNDVSANIRILLNIIYVISALSIISISIYKTQKNIISQSSLLSIIHISGIACVYMLLFQLVISILPFIYYTNYSLWEKIVVISNSLKINSIGYILNFMLLMKLIFINKYYKKKQFNINNSSDHTSGNHGTAKWADEFYLKQMNLYNPSETLVGVDERGQQIRYPICNRTIIANSGGGKSSGCLIPALLTEDRPVFCFDPKGELWAVTAKQRAVGFGRNRKIITIDPFNLIKNNDLSKGKSRELLRKYKLNTLDYISDDPNLRDRQLTNIARSCVTRDERSLSQHWFDYAEIYIKGLIEYILDKEKAENINLLTVRDYLFKNKKEMDTFINALREHGGKHTKATAAMLSNVCDEERGSIWSTTYRQLSWTSENNIIETFKESNIDLRDFIKGDMDIFVIFPEDQIQEHSNVIRLIFNSIINIYSQTEPSLLPKAKSLFILDELGQLGASRDVQQAIEILRYKQVIIWAVFQNYGQIKLYQKPESFTEAPIKQFFSTDDVLTMEWIQKLAGYKTVKAHSLAQNVNVSPQSNTLNSNVSTGENMSIQETGVPLLHLNQIREMSQNMQFVFIKGIRPILCNRIFYYKNLMLNCLADPNPYITYNI